MNLLIVLLVCFFIHSEGSTKSPFYRTEKETTESWKQQEEVALKKEAAALTKMEQARKAAESFCKACATSHGNIKTAQKEAQAARKQAEEYQKKGEEARKAAKTQAANEARRARTAQIETIKQKMVNLTSQGMVQKYLQEKQNEIYASEICRAFPNKGDQTSCAKFFKEVAGTAPHDPWSWLENK